MPRPAAITDADLCALAALVCSVVPAADHPAWARRLLRLQAAIDGLHQLRGDVAQLLQDRRQAARRPSIN
jgi:hypothetical protein